MSSGHASSRRQAYGRRMKDVRTRQGTDVEIDLEGPNGWSRGTAWEPDQSARRPSLSIDSARSSARAR